MFNVFTTDTDKAKIAFESQCGMPSPHEGLEEGKLKMKPSNQNWKIGSSGEWISHVEKNFNPGFK